MSELDFPLQEYQGRITRIREKMRERGLDTFIVLGPENIHYVSGFKCAWAACVGEFSGIIIPLEDEPRLIVRSLESKTLKKHWMRDSRMYADWEGPWKILKEILEECKATRGIIGVEGNLITVSKFDKLKEIVPEAKIVSAAGLVESLMAQPTELEVKFARKAGEITQVGLEKAIETIKDGNPYYKVITRGTDAMYEAGMTEQQLFGKYTLSCVWGGPDGGALHETDVTRKIQKGDIVTCELWGTYKHYVVGAMATVYVGNTPPPNVIDTYKVLSEMYLKAKEAMKPGVPVKEVWQAANEVYHAAYGVDYFRKLGSQKGAGFGRQLDKGRDIMTLGATYLVQAEVTDPLLMVVCASLMLTEGGCEELTTPLLELVSV